MLQISNRSLELATAYPYDRQQLTDDITSAAFRVKWGTDAIAQFRAQFRAQLQSQRMGRPCAEFLQDIEREGQRVSWAPDRLADPDEWALPTVAWAAAESSASLCGENNVGTPYAELLTE
jgi:hypothetical protein